MLASEPNELSGAAWPAGELERLGRCPCCGHGERRVLFAELTDAVMGVAPGAWTLWRCEGCGCAYLDPRPTPASIGRAYRGYHTHEGWRTPGLPAPLAMLAMRVKFQAQVMAWEGLRRARAPLPLPLARFEHRIRATPRARGPGERLLDVGFGQGYFLRDTGWLGYQSTGLDFDAEVVANGAAHGLTVVQGGFPGSGLPEGAFAQITLSNVLEHLHDPVGALEEARRLLRPGGRLWLNQPNLAARGLSLYGRAWRGLEAPRHLTLWSAEGLAALLARCGFVGVELLPVEPDAGAFYFTESELIAAGRAPGLSSEADRRAAGERAQRRLVAETHALRQPASGESVTAIGFRPT